MFTPRFAVVALGALSLLACEQKGAADAGSEPCAQLETKVCEAVGAESPDCQMFKGAVPYLSPAACRAAVNDPEHIAKAASSMKAACDTLVTKLCADLGQDTESCAMVKEQTPNFPPTRCNMMMQQYAEVLGDLQRREAGNKPLAAETQQQLVDTAAATFGPEEAKVTVVEFSDFQCPYCSMAAKTVDKIKSEYGDKVEFAFLNFPLSFHTDARPAAIAAMAAAAQGKFWAYHDKLFANQKALGKDALMTYAKELGLDMKAFTAALEDEALAKRVDEQLAMGEKLGVNGTPTLYVNGTKVQNPSDYQAVKTAIDAALQGG